MIKILKPRQYPHAIFNDGHKERIYYIKEHPEGHVEFCTESGKYVYAKPPGAYFIKNDEFKLYKKPPECYAFYRVETDVKWTGGLDELYVVAPIKEIKILDKEKKHGRN